MSFSRVSNSFFCLKFLLFHFLPQAEKLFKQALKASETLLRNYSSVNPDTKEEIIHSK